MTTSTDTRIDTTDITDGDRAEVLAEITRHQFAELLDGLPWTRAEYRQVAWMFSKATVAVTGPRQVDVTAPIGPRTRRFAHLLYTALERACNLMDTTPFAVPFTDYRGADIPGGGRMTWSA